VDPLNSIHASYVLKRRVDVLSNHLLRFLPSHCTILDIGSGDGLLGYMLQKRGTGLEIHGIDVLPREKTYIPVLTFDGVAIPYGQQEFDFALLVDVLHHTDEPMLLLREANRVARRGVIIKDHVVNGVFSRYTLCFMDWLGNARHSVRLPYNYWTQLQWEEATRQLGWRTSQWEHDLRLYPKPADLFFGRRLHFIGLFTPAVASTASDSDKGVAKLQNGVQCCSSRREQAYQEFETPCQEIEKFSKRLRKIGAMRWSRSARIIELFCGRGNGLHALRQLGFTHLEGADLSPHLLEKYSGPAKCYVCDCRKLPFSDASYDIVIIQGGLHHLVNLPGDLVASLDEIRRVLAPGGRFVMIEPWLTPFLRIVHKLCFSPVRRVSRRLNALATMIGEERATYEAWLSQPGEILALLQNRFAPKLCIKKWGKLVFVGALR
jgi:SAM-dependent methyltransferase